MLKEKPYSYYSFLSVDDFVKECKIKNTGLSDKDVESRKERYKENKKNTILSSLVKSFVNPFSVVLFIIGLISLFTEVIFPKYDKTSYSTVIIILSMLLISGIIRFSQEYKSLKITRKLIEIVNTYSQVFRNGKWISIPSNEVVQGDIVKVKVGERVPADLRILQSTNCYASQSIINGESRIVYKDSCELKSIPPKLSDYTNMLFFGTTLTSGECIGCALKVGKDTAFGDRNNYNKKKGFDKGANSIAYVLIKFMALLVPIVLILSFISTKSFFSSFIFALSVAVGLTPELLPMVITSCLGKGSYNMRQKETIVKNVNAMEGFGSIDVLCVDKTGTLTGDTLKLEYYMDVLGNEWEKTLDLAYLNSYFHSGGENHLDNAILKVRAMSNDDSHYTSIVEKYELVHEYPFVYSSMFSSVVLKDKENGGYLLISKGDVKSIVDKSSYVEYKGKEIKITSEKKESVDAVIKDLTEDGMKVLAVSIKHLNSLEDISFDNQILVGYIAFFDSPKVSSKSAIEKLKTLNVKIKVLTGDNSDTTLSICKRLGITTKKCITGKELDNFDEDEILSVVEDNCIFTELLPKQKALIVSILKNNGHKVGFLGDGMNDIPPIIEADVGISVSNAIPVVKEISDVVLLKKDLNVLEEGIKEGRKAFVNMQKYIKITASSNLGNIFAIVIASLILPFFPLTSIQLLLLNLLYDILCLSLPWDNVDEDLYTAPLEWSGKKLSRFMIFFAPCSVIFDIITFVFLLFFLCPSLSGGSFTSLSLEAQNYYVSLFQTGWFIESMWTQVLILQLLRTPKIPFIQSKPSNVLTIVTISGISIFTILIFTPLGSLLGFTKLPFIYFVFLLFNVLFYLMFVTFAKKVYLKKNKDLL